MGMELDAVCGHVDFPSSGIFFVRELVRIVCTQNDSFIASSTLQDHTSFPPL